jgi:pimeloyl-ACP methyl ester carboxylesterase
MPPLFRRAAPRWAPEPPAPLPPGRVVHVPGRGEFFVRDSGGDGPPVLLLHGWTASADLNWHAQYAALSAAGLRAIAVDHRGHGRGLRTYADFRLADCADDAVALARQMGTGPVVAAGYSMGGPIALLAARRHPDAVRAVVLCATSSNWRALRIRGLWWSMAWFRLWLGLAPHEIWRGGLRLAGMPDTATTTWMSAELVRGSARDIAEAGRELGRFDARPWLGEIATSAAVVVTREDRAVPPRWQRALANGLGAPTFDSPGDHFACGLEPEGFNAAFLAALTHVGATARATPAAAA